MLNSHPFSHPKAVLRDRYAVVRGETELLASRLSAEDQTIQSMPDASPAKWHRAHTTWFFETFVLSHRDGYKPYHPDYGFLFNSYYDIIGPRHPRAQRGLLTRPTADEIGEYRAAVDYAMSDFLKVCGDDPQVMSLVELGLHHEQQHQELLLTDILHAFAQSPLTPAYAPVRLGTRPSAWPLQFTEFDGGQVAVGHDGEGFAFDNEGPAHEVLLRPYRLASRAMTNSEWLEFMAAGGYREPRYWLADGWQRACSEAWQAPLYWRETDGAWHVMTLAGLLAVDPDAPVAHISFYEANAFARWRGCRLPTEAEWENAARQTTENSANLLDTGYLRPMATSSESLSQMFGDVWEWTGSAYLPYPGYREPEGATSEYNGKFMINQMVLRGGSCVTPSDHIRATYRNFFYPHQRWQFSGLRLAQDRPPRPRAAKDDFRENVLQGLAKPAKTLGSKFFYDDEGSRLFLRICELPEYYLTRTETTLLQTLAPELGDMLAPDTVLVEFGCGEDQKASILIEGSGVFGHYVPIDINASCLDAKKNFRARHPDVAITPVIGDFTKRLELPKDFARRPVLGFFPGSTIGNLTPAEAKAFLENARAILGPHAKFLVGIDLVKDPETLIAAYDDAAKVTAAFNKNLLTRINRELGGNFDLEAFRHRAIWNAEEQRIEMHLASDRQQTVTAAGRSFAFGPGETIHTENAHKYSVGRFAELTASAGWTLAWTWQSAPPEFAVVLLA